MSNKYTREKIKIPTSIKPKDRVKIADVIVNLIINRTAAGLDKNNKQFPNYTKKYAENKGVDEGDVDLILDGEMLESLELVSHKNGEIVIGYKDPSDELAGKVEGNRIGSYGGKPNKKKARDFLGIARDDLEIVLDSYLEDTPINESDLDILARQLADELIGDL